MSMFIITYIICGIAYIIACVMDGHDVKPRWKKWIGVRLARTADYYFPTVHRKESQFLISAFEVEKLANYVKISENEVMEARILENMAAKQGLIIPHWRTVDGMIEMAKETIVKSICKAIVDNGYIRIDVDMDSYYPSIVVRGDVYVTKRNEVNI